MIKAAYYADPSIARVRVDEPGHDTETLADAVVDGAPGCAVRFVSTHGAPDAVELRYGPDLDYVRIW